MPKIEREYVDGNGRRVIAVFTLLVDEPCFERALQHLANKAMSAKSKRATALHQAVQVLIREVP